MAENTKVHLLSVGLRKKQGAEVVANAYVRLTELEASHFGEGCYRVDKDSPLLILSRLKTPIGAIVEIETPDGGNSVIINSHKILGTWKDEDYLAYCVSISEAWKQWKDLRKQLKTMERNTSLRSVLNPIRDAYIDMPNSLRPLFLTKVVSLIISRS